MNQEMQEFIILIKTNLNLKLMGSQSIALASSEETHFNESIQNPMRTSASLLKRLDILLNETHSRGWCSAYQREQWWGKWYCRSSQQWRHTSSKHKQLQIGIHRPDAKRQKDTDFIKYQVSILESMSKSRYSLQINLSAYSINTTQMEVNWFICCSRDLLVNDAHANVMKALLSSCYGKGKGANIFGVDQSTGLSKLRPARSMDAWAGEWIKELNQKV